mmetsp:Transcript_23366/g.48521  ORF Transcript_23366/g.48521 Transcript_23366/m.48521 type:complete len:337 (+) Transcript_23366:406-1416(+)|eukprot:CAMPEP_0178631328 /NCGR_PEP_ID=MMETSP0698-20121128/10948_1 /TAXON_ID=265572 /ORGANISM="Extubocellulus spinifer, Strain CCMP396" /LENGTH=336 /DNA_ID=CAMNT_0020270741 /DNA_START=136 /DNA_END=1146 /DNA_ORIENTATION=-
MSSRSLRRSAGAAGGADEELVNNAIDIDAVVEPVTTRVSWYRSLKSLGDVFISVELTRLWYLHLVYSKKDGAELRNLFTNRFAALSTMISLFVASQVGALFSPSRPTETARTALEQLDYRNVAFWAGLALCVSLILSLLSLLATLSAWAIFNAVGTKNVHIILRSSQCLNAAALPSRLAMLSIFCYFLWLNLFWYVLADLAVAVPLSAFCMVSFFGIISTYSAVGRVMMFSGALGNEQIMDYDVESDLGGAELATALVDRVVVAKKGDIPVSQQYRIKYQEQLDILEEGGSLHLEDLLLPEYQQEREGGEDSSGSNNKQDITMSSTFVTLSDSKED